MFNRLTLYKKSNSKLVAIQYFLVALWSYRKNQFTNYTMCCPNPSANHRWTKKR